MTVLVRSAAEADAQAIVELLNPIIETGRDTILDQPLDLAAQLEFMRGITPPGYCNIAINGESGELLGIQDVLPLSADKQAFRHIGEISTFVAMQHQGCGVGKQLMQVSLNQARSSGFLKLQAMIRANNLRAIGFYQGQGFQIVGTARGHALVNGNYIDEVFTEMLLV